MDFDRSTGTKAEQREISTIDQEERGTVGTVSSCYGDGFSQQNTRSVQELHDRNDQLQSRIGNLEQLLLKRLGKPQQEVQQDQQDLSQQRSLSASQISYVNTEQQSRDGSTSNPRRTGSQTPVTKQRCLNEEPVLAAQVVENMVDDGRQQSYRSAAELLQQHQHNLHHPFQQHQPNTTSSQHYTQQSSCQENQSQIFAGSYVLTTEGTAVVAQNNPFINSGCDDLKIDSIGDSSANANSKRPKINIIDSNHDHIPGMHAKNQNQTKSRSCSRSRSPYAQTELDEQTETQSQIQQQPLPGMGASLRNNITNFMVDETMPVHNGVQHHFLHEDINRLQLSQIGESQTFQERREQLLHYLESQNAEALRAIQHENSTFIQAHSKNYGQPQQTDVSYYSVDLRRDLTALEQMMQPMSELQTTTMHQNDATNTRFLYEEQEIEGEECDNQQDNTNIVVGDGCTKCAHVNELNEALSEENERLRDHMESMILLVQQFETERARTTGTADSKISVLERQVEFLQKEKQTMYLSATRDQQETIRSLQEHVRSLERTQFQKELDSVNLSSQHQNPVAQLQKETHSTINYTENAATEKVNDTISNITTAKTNILQVSAQHGRSMDKDWQHRVSTLEQELRETKEFYLRRIEALEKGNNVFTDSSILVAGESVVDREHTGVTKTQDECLLGSFFCQNYEHHAHRLKQDQQRMEAENMQSQQLDRENLYEKLGLAEQVLEQITEELQLLSAENKFLTKLNRRLTYHACRQEKYFIDWRKHSQNPRSSYASTAQNRDSFIASQVSVMTPKGRNRQNQKQIWQVVQEAESMLKSSHHGHHQRRPNHVPPYNLPKQQLQPQPQTSPQPQPKPQPEEKITEVLAMVRAFLQQNPVSFTDQIQMQQRKAQSSSLNVSQFEKIMVNMEAPISRTDARRLFIYIATDFKEQSDPGQSKVVLTISKLCNVIDQNKKKKSSCATITSVKEVMDTAMKPDDLGKEKATIQYSEAPTYGGCDNLSSEYPEVVLKQADHVASRFDAQKSQKDLSQQSLYANSIIQLENHLKRKETNPKQQQKLAENSDPAKMSKVEQLKQRIERLSRQAKRKVNEKKQQQTDQLNRSTSEDRATQTISGSNQYKRGNRGNAAGSKEPPVHPCN